MNIAGDTAETLNSLTS